MNKEAEKRIAEILGRVILPEELEVVEEVEGHPRYFIGKRRVENLAHQIFEVLQSEEEQLANLLALWETKLPEYEPGSQGYIRLRVCIGELEAILTGKPLPRY